MKEFTTRAAEGCILEHFRYSKIQQSDISFKFFKFHFIKTNVINRLWRKIGVRLNRIML